MRFASSARSTLGVEWELALVDPLSRELVPAATEVLARVRDPRVKGEFFTNTVEIVTGVHTTTASAMSELRELRDAVLSAASEVGVAAIGSGTHPFSPWRAQELTHAERYQRLVELAGSWAQRLVIFGTHHHVGLDQPERQLTPVLGMLSDRLPLLLALTASSPFWQGEDSGYASQRLMLFQQLPSSGLPPRLHDWNDWQRAARELVAMGSVRDVGELRWDVRPSPRFGTVESRIPDGTVSLTHLHAATALTHCLVEEHLQQIDAGTVPPGLPDWTARDNRWRAARFGLDADIVTEPGGPLVPVRAAIEQTLVRLVPVAERLGALDGLEACRRVITTGGSAAQQRSVAENADLCAVVDMLVTALQAD